MVLLGDGKSSGENLNSEPQQPETRFADAPGSVQSLATSFQLRWQLWKQLWKQLLKQLWKHQSKHRCWQLAEVGLPQPGRITI